MNRKSKTSLLLIIMALGAGWLFWQVEASRAEMRERFDAIHGPPDFSAAGKRPSHTWQQADIVMLANRIERDRQVIGIGGGGKTSTAMQDWAKSVLNRIGEEQLNHTLDDDGFMCSITVERVADPDSLWDAKVPSGGSMMATHGGLHKEDKTLFRVTRCYETKGHVGMHDRQSFCGSGESDASWLSVEFNVHATDSDTDRRSLAWCIQVHYPDFLNAVALIQRTWRKQ